MTTIALIVAAACFARRLPVASVALIAAAGLVKIPYVLLGLPVLAAVPDKRARVAMAGATIGAVAVLSWLAGGAPYLRADDARGRLAVARRHSRDRGARRAGRHRRGPHGRAPAASGRVADALARSVHRFVVLDVGFSVRARTPPRAREFAIWFPLVAALVDLTIVQVFRRRPSSRPSSRVTWC